MEAIAVINQKGGVGKSTTAHAVGAGLSLRGFRVLYVDLDSQGNLTYTLGADTEGITVMDVLRNQAPVREAVRIHQEDLPLSMRPYIPSLEKGPPEPLQGGRRTPQDRLFFPRGMEIPLSPKKSILRHPGGAGGTVRSPESMSGVNMAGRQAKYRETE